MRFLADECCPAPIVAALRAAGHDVEHIQETAMGSSDEAVAAMAIASDRIILTEDYDFGEIAVRQRLALPGLVILAFSDQIEEIRVNRTLDVVATIGEALRGHLTLIAARGDRRRPLNSD